MMQYNESSVRQLDAGNVSTRLSECKQRRRVHLGVRQAKAKTNKAPDKLGTEQIIRQ